VAFSLTEDHWQQCHLKGCRWFPISLPLQPCVYLALFPRHYYVQSLKRSYDHDRTNLRDYLSIQRLIILNMANQCTKFEVSSLSRSVLQIFMGHVMWPCPFHGQFVAHRLGLALINHHIESEVSMFTHYKIWRATQNVEIGVVWGLGVTQGHHLIECIQLG